MSLDGLRKEIRAIDEKLISLLSERNVLSERVAEHKKENDLEVKDQEYEEKLINDLSLIAKQKNLDAEFITKIFREIIKNSRQIQERKISG